MAVPTTLAEALALLPDNNTGLISEQDMRDVVTFLAGALPTGGVINNGVTTVLGAIGVTPTVISGWTADGYVRGTEVTPAFATNRIKVITAGDYRLVASLDFVKTFSAKVARDVSLQARIVGGALVGRVAKIESSPASSTGAFTSTTVLRDVLASLSANDEIELVAFNSGGSGTLDFLSGSFDLEKVA